MNLILKMLYGPQSGRRRVLQPGQRALVGGTFWCDFPASDESLGDPQFSIRCGTSDCWVENLSKSNRLLVNGISVEHKKLTDGDVVSAGDSQFIARIRGRRSPVRELNAPLVGTEGFVAQFTRSVITQCSSFGEKFRGSTMSGESWSESSRVAKTGKGVPSQSFLEAATCLRAAALILDNCAVARLMAGDSRYSESDFFPLEANQAGTQEHLFLLDNKPLAELYSILDSEWAGQNVAFLVPFGTRADFRKHMQESSLWRDRTVRQASRLLVDGSYALREGLFKQVDSVVVPTEDGWMLMSRPVEQRVNRDSA